MKITRRDYRRGTKTGVKGADTKEGKAQRAAQRSKTSNVNVEKGAKAISSRNRKMRKKLDDAGDYSTPRVNELDQINKSFEHQGDTENMQRIFEK